MAIVQDAEVSLGAFDMLLEAARIASEVNQPQWSSDYADEPVDGLDPDGAMLQQATLPRRPSYQPKQKPMMAPASKKKKAKGHRCPNKLLPGGPCTCCGARLSPQWRRPLDDESVLCNACGIYYTRHKVLPERKPLPTARSKRRPADEADDLQDSEEHPDSEPEQELDAERALMEGAALPPHMRQQHTRSCESSHLALPLAHTNSPASTGEALYTTPPLANPLPHHFASKVVPMCMPVSRHMLAHLKAEPTLPKRGSLLADHSHALLVKTEFEPLAQAIPATAGDLTKLEPRLSGGSSHAGGGATKLGSAAGSTPGSPVSSPSEGSSFTPHARKRAAATFGPAGGHKHSGSTREGGLPGQQVDMPGLLAGTVGGVSMRPPSKRSRSRRTHPEAVVPKVELEDESCLSPQSAAAALLKQLAAQQATGDLAALLMPHAPLAAPDPSTHAHGHNGAGALTHEPQQLSAQPSMGAGQATLVAGPCMQTVTVQQGPGGGTTQVVVGVPSFLLQSPHMVGGSLQNLQAVQCILPQGMTQQVATGLPTGTATGGLVGADQASTAPAPQQPTVVVAHPAAQAQARLPGAASEGAQASVTLSHVPVTQLGMPHVQMVGPSGAMVAAHMGTLSNSGAQGGMGHFVLGSVMSQAQAPGAAAAHTQQLQQGVGSAGAAPGQATHPNVSMQPVNMVLVGRAMGQPATAVTLPPGFRLAGMAQGMPQGSVQMLGAVPHQPGAGQALQMAPMQVMHVPWTWAMSAPVQAGNQAPPAMS